MQYFIAISFVILGVMSYTYTALNTTPIQLLQNDGI